MAFSMKADGTTALTHSALTQSFAMIIASEIGDKTFLIAAILAMRHPRAVVFAGAFGSLIAMSCLSAAMGHILPTLIPRKWTQFAAAVLFLVFGLKMLQEGRHMEAGSGRIQEELKEVEEEIEDEEAQLDGTGARHQNGAAIPLEAMEEGGRIMLENGDEMNTPSAKRTRSSSLKEGARNFFALLLGPVFVQSFILTFLGEWGDRSQIATIALAAAHVRVYSFEVLLVVDIPLCRMFTWWPSALWLAMHVVLPWLSSAAAGYPLKYLSNMVCPYLCDFFNPLTVYLNLK